MLAVAEVTRQVIDGRRQTLGGTPLRGCRYIGVGFLQWHVRRTTNEPYMGKIQGQRNVYAHLQNTIEPPSRHAS